MKTILAIITLLLSTSSNASFITTGTLWNGNAGDDWIFTTTGGVVTIDILSWELSPSFDNRQSAIVRDLNGDGEAAFFDSFITLYKGNTIIAQNDDSFESAAPFPLPGFDDGSIFQYDSYLSLFLAPGNYTLNVSTFNGQSPLTCIGAIGEMCDGTGPIANDHGDYAITWSGDVSIIRSPLSVSAPATSMLFGLSALLLCFMRRK